MKKHYLNAFLALGLTASAQAQLARIVVEGTGGLQVFTDIGAAVAAAQPNDKIYLSGGTFTMAGDLVLDKPLHFIGAGLHPDSSAVTGTTSIATSSGETQVFTSASGSTFTGIRFADVVQFGNGTTDYSPTSLVFQRCEFGSYMNMGAGSEASYDECIFRHRLYGYDGTALVTRCIFSFWGNATHQPISSFGTGGLTMDHCTVLGGRVSNSGNSTITNCIFTKDNGAPFWQSSGSTLTNNLCVYTALVSNMTPASATGNVLGVSYADSVFVNETSGYYDFSDDIHLAPVSPGIGMATDGTDVGAYGTSSPYKPGAVPNNPHFQTGVIAPAADGNGDLPVSIRTAAQTH